MRNIIDLELEQFGMLDKRICELNDCYGLDVRIDIKCEVMYLDIKEENDRDIVLSEGRDVECFKYWFCIFIDGVFYDIFKMWMIDFNKWRRVNNKWLNEEVEFKLYDMVMDF